MKSLSLINIIVFTLCLAKQSYSFSVTSFSAAGMSRACIIMKMSENDISSEGDQVEVKCPNCDLCDGSGRILGGIPTIPGFRWWPIKPYRPCPNFIKNGGQYSRIGQPLDEIAFGRGNLQDEEDDDF